MKPIVLLPLRGLPIIQPGDDLVALLAEALRCWGGAQEGDVLVIAHKIVSKAEGRFVRLSEVTPSPRARDLAQTTGKDPRLLEVILWDTNEILRAQPGLIIVEHHLGFICANAGVDRSNVAPEGEEIVLRLPEDPDGSAHRIREGIRQRFGVDVGVVIADSHGRAHRKGVIGVAIGVSGLPALEDWRGRPDLFGYILQHTEVALGDLLASAATLLMGQAAEGIPAVLIRGVPFTRRESSARELIRERTHDLFR
ncbi:MAG: coenzyme F420-0:L-glutamate ligase [Anaerolineae bacterium]|nr:coenzyme F420-0:L-glutamate ligase [Thermoflexus sp.]MDW8064382.1 coenzyme F420-0:L-glutamate ligase [Anaerolineae bacterium]